MRKNFAEENYIMSVHDNIVSVRLQVGYIGYAHCNPTDEFHVELGHDIAYRRALIARNQAEIDMLIKFCTN